MAAVAACALATTAGAQQASAGTATIDTLAREWSRGLGAPRCVDENLLAGRTAQCTWGPAQSRVAPWVQYTPSAMRGAPAVVTWNRLASNPAHAQRMLDSLDAALVARGATRRSCGTGDVPAGTVTGTLWESPTLTVIANRMDEPSGTARTYVVASDQASVMSLDVLCPRPGAAPPVRDTTRVRVLDAGGTVFRADSVRLVQSVALGGDSAIAIVHYRVGRPAADSTDVRRALARTLGRPGSLDRDPAFQAAVGGVGRVRRLVVRPCYTDACPPTGGNRFSFREAGDLRFARWADGSWREQR